MAPGRARRQDDGIPKDHSAHGHLQAAPHPGRAIRLTRNQSYRTSCSVPFQVPDGGGRHSRFIGNQYATYYTGYVLALLLQAGFGGEGLDGLESALRKA